MGFRFRKSKKVGPFRINMSQKGIGWSVGVKGLRYTKKAGGGSRVTASIPGTGISYVTDSKKPSHQSRPEITAPDQSFWTRRPLPPGKIIIHRLCLAGPEAAAESAPAMAACGGCWPSCSGPSPSPYGSGAAALSPTRP